MTKKATTRALEMVQGLPNATRALNARLIAAFGLILSLAIAPQILQAQPRVAMATEEPSTEEINREAEAFMHRLDSLADQHVFSHKNREIQTKRLNKYGFKPGDVPVYPDSVYEARLKKIEAGIPYDYNQYVKSFINLYTVRKRGLSERVLGLSTFYFPMFESIMEKENLPHAFVYLAVVESSLNPNAVSPVGATGIWQFMYETGKMYKLGVNYYVDERRDPRKACMAAAEYFKDMYRLYGDWQLVLASYNCGAGNVNRAIRRSGKKNPSFWEIMPYLPKETRSYVPAVIAVAYMMNYSAEHNLYPIDIRLPYSTDTIQVQGPASFGTMAQVLGTTEKVIEDLNPAMKRQYIPSDGYSYVMNVPAKSVSLWEKRSDSLYASIRSNHAPTTQPNLGEVLASDSQKNSEGASASSNSTSGRLKDQTAASESTGNAAPANARIAYIVKRGDNLKMIADLYSVTTNSMRRWNRMRSSAVKVGQRLYVYVPTDKKRELLAVNSMSLSQKQKALGIEVPKKAPAAKPAPTLAQAKAQNEAGKAGSYTVQRGDTLWSISQKTGMSVEELKKLNGLTDARALRAGMVIKVKKA